MNTNNTTQMINNTTATNAVILTAMYEVAFNREPDVEGFQYWMNEMANGKTAHDVAKAWQVHLPVISLNNYEDVVDTFVYNGYEHHANQPTINYWGVLAINAVPSYELVYDAAVQLVGMQNDYFTFNAVY